MRAVSSLEKPYKCFQCNLNKQKNPFWRKPYKCAQCNYSATKSSNLKVHIRAHHSEG